MPSEPEPPTPSSPSAAPQQQQQAMKTLATNSVLIANLPRDSFTDNFAAFLRTIAAKYGPIRKFVPLKSFARCIVTYAKMVDACKARLSLEGDLEASGIEGARVYYADHVKIDDDDDTDKYLQVPHLERNFLLSPPGSPPIGWVQGYEQAPNANTHHPELLSALAELESDQFTLDPDAEHHHGDEHSDSEDTASGSPRTEAPPRPAPQQQLRLTITPRAPGEDPMLDSPVAILVEDWNTASNHHVLSNEEIEAQERGNVEFRHRIDQDMDSWMRFSQSQTTSQGTTGFGGVSARRRGQALPRTAMPPVSHS